MNSATCDCRDLDGAAYKEARTARSNRAVFYTGLWRLLIELFKCPAFRLHRKKWLGARLLEKALRDEEGRQCR